MLRGVEGQTRRGIRCFKERVEIHMRHGGERQRHYDEFKEMYSQWDKEKKGTRWDIAPEKEERPLVSSKRHQDHRGGASLVSEMLNEWPTYVAKRGISGRGGTRPAIPCMVTRDPGQRPNGKRGRN